MFDNSRDVKQIPHLLGISTHAALAPLLPLKRNRWILIKSLNRVIYRADPQSQFQTFPIWTTGIRQLKNVLRKQVQNLSSPREPSLPLAYSSIRSEALFKHFLSIASQCPDFLFSLPANLFYADSMEQRQSLQLVPSLVDLQSALTMTQGVRFEADMGSDLANVEDSSMVSRDMIHSSRSVDCLIFLKVVSTRPSSRKTISLSPAEAGVCGRLKASDVAVNVHEARSFAGSEEHWVCACVTPALKKVIVAPDSFKVLTVFAI